MKRNETLTAYEKEKEAFIARLIEGFETVFAHRSDVVQLDGADTPEQVAEKAIQAINAWMHLHGIIP